MTTHAPPGGDTTDAPPSGDTTDAPPSGDTTDTPRPWSSSWPDHVGETVAVDHATVLAAWDAWVADAPGATACWFHDAPVTVAELDAAGDALAAGLTRHGTRAGDRVGVWLQNDVQWPAALLACWRLGAIPVALNPMFTADELRFHLRDSGASVLLCLEELHDRAASVLGDTDVHTVVTTHPLDLVDDSRLSPPTRDSYGQSDPPPDAVALAALVADGDGTVDARTSQSVDTRTSQSADARTSQAADARTSQSVDGRSSPSPDDVALLTYTSGTTGRPKGAMNTHGGVAHQARLYADWFRVDGDDVVLAVAPLFHITGSVAHVALSWVARAPMVLFHRFDAGEALRLVEHHRASFVVGSITVFVALMEHEAIATSDLSSLRSVASGGAPVSPAVVERFHEATGATIRNIYGLTETTSPSHMTPPDAVDPPVDPDSGALSVGVPVPGADSRVVDVDTGEPLPPGEAGEIVVRGPMVVPGYWEQPEETAHAIRDGWLHTGDVGVMTEDGWFFVVDRLKDQINVSGFKVWPREVEDALYEHPAVREAAVVGVPDDYRGETVKAFVSLRRGAAATPAELVAFAGERLAAYKRPREVEVLEQLPTTASGKIRRRDLRST